MNDECVQDVIGFTQSTAAPAEHSSAEPGSEPAFGTAADADCDGVSPATRSAGECPIDRFTPAEAASPVTHAADQPETTDTAATTDGRIATPRSPVHAQPFSATALMLRRRSASTLSGRGLA